MLHARAASETERPWKTLKMAQIYDFPRAARAEHGHGAKKVLAGVRFQWTDPKKFLRPRWRAGGRSVSYVPRFFCRASLWVVGGVSVCVLHTHGLAAVYSS